MNRRLNPYILYGNDRRDTLCAENPTFSQAQIMKLLAEEWRTLPENTRNYYKQRSIQGKDQVENEYGEASR